MRLTSKELGHVIMCAYGRGPSGNLQRTGGTGHTLTRTVSDLLRSRRPLAIRDGFAGGAAAGWVPSFICSQPGRTGDHAPVGGCGGSPVQETRGRRIGSL